MPVLRRFCKSDELRLGTGGSARNHQRQDHQQLAKPDCMHRCGFEFGLTDHGCLPGDLQYGAHITSIDYRTGVLAHYGMSVGALGYLL